MANPFTLALNGGSYTIFLFLLHPITLSYLVLRWFDLGDDFEALKVLCFELTSTFAMTATIAMMTATMASWFIWDPGGMSPMESIDPVDRTDRPPAPLHASIGSMSPIEFLSLIAWLFRPSLSSSRPSVTMASTMASLASLRLSIAICLPVLRHPFLLRPTRPMVFRFPAQAQETTMVRPLTPSVFQHCPTSIQSLFQYSHPVLSRPTVPNIDS